MASSFDDKPSLGVSQESRFQRAVWHYEQEDDPSHHGEETPDKEDDLPAREGDASTKRASSYAISDEPTQDVGESIEAKPDASSEALLLLCVPLRREEDKAWSDGGLKHAQDQAD